MSQNILVPDNIQLRASFRDKEEAIRYAGNILVENGYVMDTYIDDMLEREQISTTYMGNYVAIPHGTEESKKSVIKTGISVITIPEGVDFGDGNLVKVIIGIAGKGDEHLEVLSKIAIVLSNEENIERIVSTKSKEEIIQIFDEVT